MPPNEPAANPAPPPRLGPSPLSAGDRQLSVEAARSAIASAIPCLVGEEAVPIARAAGRVLAADLASPIDVPAHDNSAMDGYAFDGAALVRGEALALRAVGEVMAGRPHEGRIDAGQCLRIMTGAVMPAGLDTVVPLELCRVEDDLVQLRPDAVVRGENRRRRGEDLAVGRVALADGRWLRPADVGLAASLGFTALTVRRRLRVALFSTGDEVVAPGQTLAPGAIYDSNRFALAAAIERLGMEVIDLGLLRDDPALLEAALRQAIEQADVVITSGGVSAGDADHTRAVLARLGTVGFWKVAMRPGRPFAFGELAPGGPGAAGGRRAWLFALPGNPVAALVTFYVLARDGLLRAAGASPAPLPRLRARSAEAIRKRPGRSEFQRAMVTQAADGVPEARLFGSQGAGILRSMCEANALVLLGHEQGSVAAGEMVDVWLFDGLA